MNGQVIVQYLEMVANSNLWVNFLMHLVVFFAIAVIFAANSDQFKRLVFKAALTVLFLSVMVNAIIHGNPFHIVTFAILTVTALVQLCLGKKKIEITRSKTTLVIAIFFIFIGIWYPDFIQKNLFMLLFVSPVGVIPCPTLLTTLGLMTLVSPGLSKNQYLITAIMGLIYGIIGVFVLKVYLDITLLVLAIYCFSLFFFRFSRNADIVVKS